MVFMLRALLIGKGEKIIGDEDIKPKNPDFENFQPEYLY